MPTRRGLVIGDRDMVLAALLGRQAQMAAGLPRDLVAEDPQRPGEFAAREIPRQLHAAITSSRV